MKRNRLGFALAIAMGVAGPAWGAEPGTIEYRVRFLDVDGLTWRESLASQFHRVKTEGPATVWTAPKHVGESLAKASVKVLAAPACLVEENKKAEIRWSATEAKGEAAQSRIAMSGRRLDQGILTHIVVEDGSIAEKKSEGARTLDVARGKVEGEWLVPSDQVLVLSLGIQSVAGGEGNAVRERLAIIEPSLKAAEIKTAATVGPARMPSRSSPTAVHPDGRVAEPSSPAPADPEVSTTSGETVRPSPQTTGTPQARVEKVDGALARTAYESDDVSSEPGESVIRLPIQGGKVLEIRTRVLNAKDRPAKP